MLQDVLLPITSLVEWIPPSPQRASNGSHWPSEHWTNPLEQLDGIALGVTVDGTTLAPSLNCSTTDNVSGGGKWYWMKILVHVLQ